MQIKIYDDIQLMTGHGEEWLVDSLGNPRAVFIDGKLKGNGSDDDITLVNYCDA